MQTLTEELYTYRNFLFPQHAGKRIQIHVLFWMFFVCCHLLFFLPTYPHRLVEPVVVFAYILYYGRFALVYYSMVGFYRHLRSKVGVRHRLFYLVVFSVFCSHLISVVLYRVFQQTVGFENLPAGFGLVGEHYLRPLGERRAPDLLIFIFDIQELQLIAFPIGIKMTKYGVHLVRQEMFRQQQKLEAELRFLRTQLTPHFIVSILNSASGELGLYSMKASKYLSQASNLIRFSIHDSEREFIELNKELYYIQQYVELESMRTMQRSKVSMKVRGAVMINHFVPTLILMTLVENAFKHSVYSSDDVSVIDIHCKVSKGQLFFQVSNSIPLEKSSHGDQSSYGGIGLANVKRTLELNYGRSHHFEVSQTELLFSVVTRFPLIVQKANFI